MDRMDEWMEWNGMEWMKGLFVQMDGWMDFSTKG